MTVSPTALLVEGRRADTGAVFDSATITSASSGDSTAPTAPSGLSATAVSSSQVDLRWTASTDAVGVAGYDVFRGGTLVTTVSGTSASDTGLTPNTSYTYTVKARDAAGNVSPASTAATTTTLPQGRASRPPSPRRRTHGCSRRTRPRTMEPPPHWVPTRTRRLRWRAS